MDYSKQRIDSNRMKAKRSYAIWSKYFGKEYDMIVDNNSTNLLVKARNKWELIEYADEEYDKKLEEFMKELKERMVHDGMD